MTEPRYVVTSNTKINIAIGLLVGVLAALLGATWKVSRWTAQIEARVERLEDEKCPCRDFLPVAPPRADR